MVYVICADGACSGNPGPGGFAYEIWDETPAPGNEISEGSGAHPETTNNIMELRAAICALEDILDRGLPPGTVLLRLDSEYVLKGAFEWLEGWKSRGWKTAGKKPVKNSDLWRDLDEMLSRGRAEGWDVRPDWVRGHEGDFGNERVDTMAASKRDEAKSCFHADHGPATSDPTPPCRDDITQEQVLLLREILSGYLSGDDTVKSTLQKLRDNAAALGIS